MPPPTGVVSGPLMADPVLLDGVEGVLGEPVAASGCSAFSPASTSNQAIERAPP